MDQVDSFGRITRDRYVTVLPDDISDGEAAFLSLSSIGLHASGRGQIGVGGRCLVLGLGLLGLFSGQGAVVRGGSSIGVDRIPLRLEKAMEVGFESVLDFSRDTYWKDLAGLGSFRRSNRDHGQQRTYRRGDDPRIDQAGRTVCDGRWALEGQLRLQLGPSL